MFYSAKTGGFYEKKIHGNNVPKDAVEISNDEHMALLEGQASGMLIVPDVGGYPLLQDPPPPTIDQLAADKLDDLEQGLQSELAGGMAYTMPDGTAEVVQTRPQDEPNLLGLAIEARDLRDAGETGAVLQLRAQSNVVYSLTPQQMIDLTDAAKSFKKQWLAHSWAKKDAVRTALANDDRAGIEAVTW